MTEVEVFNADAVERHLRRVAVDFLRDEEGRFLVMWGPSDARSVDLQIWYGAEGPEQQLYAVRVTTPRYYRAAHRPALLELLNRWNEEMRAPKVYLTPTAKRSLLNVVAEGQLDLSCGLHQGGVDHFSVTTVGLADVFFRWLEAEYGALERADGDFTELESWLRDAS